MIIKYLLNIVAESKNEVIDCYKDRIVFLEEQVELQRKRADLAVDQLLMQKGARTVMPEKIVFPHLDIPESDIDQIKNELEQVG